VSKLELKKIRIREHLGIVTNDTSTTQFNFLVTPLKNRRVIAKEDYILLDHPVFGPNSPLIAQVSEVRSYEEIVGTTLSDKVGRIIATADILGYINLQDNVKPLHKLLTPPSPGGRIYMPYAEFLEDLFARDLNGYPLKQPIHLGNLESEATTVDENSKPINVYIDAKDLTSKHTLITAMDGAGKTHTATIIITEIANKTTHPIIITDPYGEYKKIKKHTTKSTEKITYKPDNTLKDPIKIIKTNQITILNTEHLTPEEKNQTLTKQLKTLWKTRLQGTTPPFLLVVEDAEKLKNETLKAIAYEGTKYGIALLLIVKHPTELGGKILSQTSTQIMGRTTDKDDIEHLKNMTLEKTKHLPKLKQGEWIINGINTREPTKIITRQLKKTS
jgi:DNA helicase HerA-like ATPase